MFSSRKSDLDNSPFSPFKDADVPSDWSTPSGSDMGGSSDIAADFLPTPSEKSPFGEASASAPEASSHNVLNSDVTVVGTLRFTEDLLVDGTVEGEITSEGVLTVGKNATIQAGEKNKVAVRTKSAIIHGRVIGDVVVTDLVELSESAELVGDVTAARISIQDGAVLMGHCSVGKATVMPTPSVPKRTGAKRAAVQDDTPNLLG